VAIAALPLAWAALGHGRVQGSGGPGLVGGGMLAAVLTIPAIADHGLLISFKFPSLLQPLLLVVAGLGISACAWAGAAPAGRLLRRLLTAACLLLLAAAAVFLLAPRAVSEVQAGFTGWLLHRDAWLDTVAEFKPLLRKDGQGQITYGFAYWSLGWAAFAAPLVLPVAAAVTWRRPRGRWLVIMAAAILGLTLLQNRFGRVAVPFLGVLIGLVLMAGLRRLARGRRWLLAAPVPLVLLGVAFLFDLPTREWLYREESPRLTPVLDIAFDLRDLPPPPGAPRGVLTNWSYGHQVQVQSGLPVVINGFGSYLDEPAFWAAIKIFSVSPEAFDAYLLANQIGTVVAGTATIGNEVSGANDSATFDKGGLNQPYMAGLPLSPLLIAGSGVPNWNVPHLPHLMPRAASSATVRGLAFPLPFLWSYERVEGGTVRGTAAAGARVVAELRFTERGRPHTYKAWADVGPEGRWSLVLPFPTDLLRPTIRSESRWSVAAGGGAPVEFALPEEQVRGGGVLEVGWLAVGR
jgi:hypothetical protein